MSWEDTLTVVLAGFVLFVTVFFIGIGLWLAAVLTGNTHYEYRCVDGVKESREVIWGVGFGAFSPVDGDPAGACN